MKKYSVICLIFLFISNFTFGLGKLTLIEKPCKINNDSMPLVIFYTGDGGWRPYDEQLADSLNNLNIPVLGINSLDYFRKRRTPAECADDITSVIYSHLEKWHKKSIIIIGYSFGAEADCK